jgi:outer membrane receptor for monomeric catechols
MVGFSMADSCVIPICWRNRNVTHKQKNKQKQKKNKTNKHTRPSTAQTEHAIVTGFVLNDKTGDT